ncbi:MAG: response regulator [Acidobacteriota bacterium]
MNHTILIAEDNPELLDVLSLQFDWHGYRVLRARDGLEALQQIDSEPDVLLLDVMMPRKNGYEVCRTIKNDPELHDLPVILLTGRRTESDREWGLDCGADVYMTKPFGIQELERQVGRLLAQRRAERSGGLREHGEAETLEQVLCRWKLESAGALHYRQKYGELEYQRVLRELPAVLTGKLEAWGVPHYKQCDDYEAVSLLLPGPRDRLQATLERLTAIGNNFLRSCHNPDEISAAGGARPRGGCRAGAESPVLRLVPQSGPEKDELP